MINLAAVLTAVLVLVAEPGDVTSARGIACDTAQQVADFIDLTDGDTANQEEAIQAINTTAGKAHACMVMNMIIKKGPTVRSHAVAGRAWVIFEVDVVALGGPMGWMGIEPSKQFMAMPAEGTGI